MKMSEWQQRSTRMKTMKVLSKPERLEHKSLEHRVKKLEHRKKYSRLLKPSTMSALSASEYTSLQLIRYDVPCNYSPKY